MKKGFTLLEIMITMGIIAIISAMLTVNYISARVRERDSRRKSDLVKIQSALELYRADNQRYPPISDVDGWVDIRGADDLSPRYITEVPQDPVSEDNCPGYLYMVMPGFQRYTIYTVLENQNDSVVIGTKPTPKAAAPSFTNNGNVTVTVTTGTCGTPDTDYNYWVNSP